MSRVGLAQLQQIHDDLNAMVKGKANILVTMAQVVANQLIILKYLIERETNASRTEFK